MNSSDYNRYLSAIKTANDFSDDDRTRDLLRKIHADMVANYGANEPDVEYLFRQFRLHI